MNMQAKGMKAREFWKVKGWMFMMMKKATMKTSLGKRGYTGYYRGYYKGYFKGYGRKAWGVGRCCKYRNPFLLERYKSRISRRHAGSGCCCDFISRPCTCRVLGNSEYADLKRFNFSCYDSRHLWK